MTTAPSKRAAEATALQELWAASDRAYERARRREVCAARIEHHERLAEVFRGHVDRHEREQERYHQILQDICAIKRGEGIEPSS